MKIRIRLLVSMLAILIVGINCFSYFQSSLSLNTETFLASPVAGNQRYPVSSYANGVHLVAWQEGNETWGGDSQIRGLIVSNAGVYGSSFLISNAADVQENPAIATDGTNFLVVWQDFRNGSNYDVWGARVNSSGTVLDGSGIRIGTGTNNQCFPTVSFDGTNFIVAWMDNSIVEQSYHIRAARVSTSGNLLDNNSVYLVGPNDTATINAAMANGFIYVPMVSMPTISCGSNQKCLLGYLVKNGADTTGSEKPYYNWLTTSPGIVVSSSAVYLPSAPSVYGGGPATHGTPAVSNRGSDHYLYVNAGPRFRGNGESYVGALPIDYGNTNPSTTLGVQNKSNRTWSGRSAIAVDGDKFFIVWSYYDALLAFPPRYYSIAGATIDSSNTITNFTAFSSSTIYRGWPCVSVGSNNALLVYEKDAGAAGLEIAGVLWDKTRLPLDVTPPPPAGFGFSLSNSGNKTVVQGSSTSNAITATLTSGTSESLSYSVGSLPSGVTFSFSNSSCAPSCNTMLTLNASSGATTGTSTVTVTATNGTISQTTSFSLTVSAYNPPPPPPLPPARPKNLRLGPGPPSPPPPGTLSVPITVQEAIPYGVPGVARASEPVTVGIPLASDSGIKTTDRLGLSGASVGQFRTLAKWPNGNIKWVLVDTLASLSAGDTASITLNDNGNGNFGGSNVCTDNGSTITAATGAATFVVKKANFNVFDSVVVGGVTLVTTGNSGGARARNYANDTTYSSINDANSIAVIDANGAENGPARCVVKATGSLKSGGNRLLDYTLRLHFYKGKSYVKAFATIRNASISYPVNQTFRSFDVVVPLTLGSGVTAEYSLPTSTTRTSLSSGDTSYLLQGYSNAGSVYDSATNCDDWDPPLLGTCPSKYVFDTDHSIGLEIKKNATFINQMHGDMTEWTQGYAGVEDSVGRGVAMALRWMPSYWPAGFEINNIDGKTVETDIELFSRNSAWGRLRLRFQRHEGREILWDFYTDGKTKKNALYELQYPLVARASLTYYQRTGGIYGQVGVSTAAEQSQLWTDMNQSWYPTSPSLANPLMNDVHRWQNFAIGGGANQTDFALNDLMDYLRTGNAGYYVRGENRTLFIVHVGILRSDDFSQEDYGNVATSDPTCNCVSLNGRAVMDLDHSHVMSIPFYYFISGNEEAREGFEDYGQYLRKLGYTGKGCPGGDSRAWSRLVRNLALSYQFSCDLGSCNSNYKSIVDTAVDWVLDSRDIPGTYTVGRNLDRGYWYPSGESSWSPPGRAISGLFHTQIISECLYEIWRVMGEVGWASARRQELEDCLLGFSHFIYDEMLSENPGDSRPEMRYGFFYDYPLDEYKDPASVGIGPYDASRAAAFLYQHTGNADYLTKGGRLIVGASYHASSRTPSELQDQSLIYIYNDYAYNNSANTPVWKPLIPNGVSDNGGGSYTISWTVPTGATQYQIKCSDKPIVEWLGFNKVTRTYAYDPGRYTAFFAANNIANSPAPAQAGTTQTLTVTLDASKRWYFSVKYLSDGR